MLYTNSLRNTRARTYEISFPLRAQGLSFFIAQGRVAARDGRERYRVEVSFPLGFWRWRERERQARCFEDFVQAISRWMGMVAGHRDVKETRGFRG